MAPAVIDLPKLSHVTSAAAGRGKITARFRSIIDTGNFLARVLPIQRVIADIGMQVKVILNPSYESSPRNILWCLDKGLEHKLLAI